MNIRPVNDIVYFCKSDIFINLFMYISKQIYLFKRLNLHI